MQQIELFLVSVLLWGGVLAYLILLYLRMNNIEKTMKTLASAIEED